MRICQLGYMGPGLKNERQLEDLDTAAAHFAKLSERSSLSLLQAAWPHCEELSGKIQECDL